MLLAAVKEADVAKCTSAASCMSLISQQLDVRFCWYSCAGI